MGREAEEAGEVALLQRGWGKRQCAYRSPGSLVEMKILILKIWPADHTLRIRTDRQTRRARGLDLRGSPKDPQACTLSPVPAVTVLLAWGSASGWDHSQHPAQRVQEPNLLRRGDV